MNFIKKLLFLLLLAPSLTHGQVISTVAGCGIASYAGDGGPAAAAYIYHPRDVVTDRHGNIFFTEEGNQVIRKIDTFGIITTVAGIGGTPGFSGDGASALGAQLSGPIGIALDIADNIYFVDYNNHRLRKVDVSGNINTIAGTGTLGYNGDSIAATAAMLGYPMDVAVDSSGNVLIPEPGNHRIRKIDAAGVITTIAGVGTPGFSGDGGGATAAQLTPIGIVIDKKNNIYFTDSSHRVRQINAAGFISTIAGNGTSTYSGDGGAATAAGLSTLEGLAVDDSDNIYITDVDKVRKISPDGLIVRIAGAGTAVYSGDGGDPLLANLSGTTGVAISNKGEIYIAANANNRVRCIGCKAPTKIPNITADETPKMIISPNPTSSSCNINLNSVLNEGIQYKIYDALGRLVRQVSAVTNVPLTIELNSPVGVYYVQAITSSGILTEKIIVQ